MNILNMISHDFFFYNLYQYILIINSIKKYRGWSLPHPLSISHQFYLKRSIYHCILKLLRNHLGVVFQQFIRHKMLLLIAYYILLVDRKAFCPYRIDRRKFIQIQAKYSKILS